VVSGKGDGDTPVPGFKARQSALSALARVLDERVALDKALETEFGQISEQADRNLVRAIVTTSLRRKGQIDAAIERHMRKALPAKSGPARYILLAGAAQLLFMRVPAHASIDLAVRQARRDRNARHFSGLINAVLRRVSEMPADMADAEAGRLNTPDWLWSRWVATYGEDTACRIAGAHLNEAALDISVKHPREAERWAETLGGELLPGGSIRAGGQRGAVSGLAGYEEGRWWVQDVAASLPVKLLGNVRGKRVLDLCAAPGGKTAQLAAAGAVVTAVDNSAARLERLRENLHRLSLPAEVVLDDAASYRASQPFDAVLCDAPCSATGTIRRHPDLPHIKPADEIDKLLAVQAAILNSASRAAKPGGLIVYATCSLEPQEGEDQVSGLSGVERLALTGRDVFGASHLLTEAGDLRTLPFHHLGEARGMDGFFAARLRKM
jgi:16S rRNA (cytosine967-C5)-methyltransferase